MLGIENRNSAHAWAQHCCTNLAILDPRPLTFLTAREGSGELCASKAKIWQSQLHSACSVQNQNGGLLGCSYCVCRRHFIVSIINQSGQTFWLSSPELFSLRKRRALWSRMEPGQTTTASCNIHKCCMKNLSIFKFESTTPNKCFSLSEKKTFFHRSILLQREKQAFGNRPKKLFPRSLP